MNKVAIYARVSNSNGSQDYQRQINDLTNLILSSGYKNDQIDIYAESISGYKTKTERPELNRLLTTIEKDSAYYEMVYCTEISRLGRNPSETRQTIDMLTDRNVPIFIQSLGRATLDKDGKRDSIMNIILQVLLEFANAESEQMKARSKSGLLTSAKAGKSGGSKHQAYGYKKDKNKMLVVDEEEAEVVREIFDLYLQGNGTKVIARILNSKKVPTRYNKVYGNQTIKFNFEKAGDKIRWVDGTVLGIISNPLYKGQRRFKGELLEAPRIVSDKVFDACEEIRKTKTHKNKLTTYTYLLKDLMSCGCCGRNYFAKYKPVKDGDKVYICSSALIAGGRCANKGINISLIETAIMNELMVSDVVSKYVGTAQEMKKELENDIIWLESQLDMEKDNLPSKIAEKERLLDIYLQGVIKTEVFQAKDAKINTQIANIEKRINQIKKELKEKNIIITKHTEDGTTQKMLQAAINNRTELRSIFKQIIHKGVVTDLNQRLCLVTLYMQIDGVVLHPVNIVIDKFSIRKKRLRYASLWRLIDNSPLVKPESEFIKFENDILTGDKEEILNELEVIISDLEENLNYEPYYWTTIDNLLVVEPVN